VFASAARTFFDRPAPGGYLAEWAKWLAQSGEAGGPEAGEALATSERNGVAVLIFRIGQEWLAFRTQTVAEVTLPRPVHRIPHRSNDVLIGLVNLRGQLQLCISLAGLLGVEWTEGAHPSSSPQARPDVEAAGTGSGADSHGGPGEKFTAAPGNRLVVLRDRDRAETWVFPAEEVVGVHRLARSQVGGVSSSLANPDVSFSQAILSWQDRSVSFLDEQRVFAALRSIGQ
jgi:chemotaxis-related protein WspD